MEQITPNENAQLYEERNPKYLARNIPRNFNEWQALREKLPPQLVRMGMGNYDDKIFLFPKTWFDFIPQGFVVHSIVGEERHFDRETENQDTRYGYLAFGIKLGD